MLYNDSSIGSPDSSVVATAIINCVAEGTIDVRSRGIVSAGGLFGRISNAEITASRFEGESLDVRSDTANNDLPNFIGGIAGRTTYDTNFDYCHSLGGTIKVDASVYQIRVADGLSGVLVEKP